MRILLICPSSLNSGELEIPYLDLRGLYYSLGVPILKKIISEDHEVKMLFYDHAVNSVRKILGEAAKSDITGFSLINFF